MEVAVPLDRHHAAEKMFLRFQRSRAHVIAAIAAGETVTQRVHVQYIANSVLGGFLVVADP